MIKILDELQKCISDDITKIINDLDAEKLILYFLQDREYLFSPILNEVSLNDDIILKIPKIHLIKLNFKEPTKEKIEDAIQLFYNTNRFVIKRIYSTITNMKHLIYSIYNEQGRKSSGSIYPMTFRSFYNISIDILNFFP